MKKNIAIILAMLPLFAAASFAQNPNDGLTMICKTSDGTLTISEQSVQLADYQLHFDGFIADGVVRFTDPANNTVAVLDARADDGLYLEVRENQMTMQVVAPRAEIRYRFENNGSEPSAPAWSSLMHKFRNTAKADRR